MVGTAGQDLVNQRIPTVAAARGTPGYGPAYSGLVEAMLARHPETPPPAPPAIEAAPSPGGRTVFARPGPSGDANDISAGTPHRGMGFSGPAGSLFGDETFSDVEPGMMGFGGFSVGTGITPNVPGDYGQLHDVVAFDPGAAIGGLVGGLAGPFGGIAGGYLGGLATPEVPVASVGRIGSVVDVLSDPSNYAGTTVDMAQARFAEPPQLDLSGGPMSGPNSVAGGAPGYGFGAGAPAVGAPLDIRGTVGGGGYGGSRGRGGGGGYGGAGYGDPGGPRGGEYSGRGTGGLY